VILGECLLGLMGGPSNYFQQSDHKPNNAKQVSGSQETMDSTGG